MCMTKMLLSRRQKRLGLWTLAGSLTTTKRASAAEVSIREEEEGKRV